MQANPTGAGGAMPDDQQPVTITTTRRHLHTLRTVMLRDLDELLKGAEESIHHMAETSTDWTGEGDLPAHTRAHDTRSHVAWIVEAVETLDDLGWAREAEWKGYRA